MELILGLLILVICLKVFVGISIGLFKFLLGILVFIGIISLAPIGILAIGLILPIIVILCVLGCIGFILKILF